MGEWLTTQEAAKALTVSGSRVRAMVSDGLLVGEKRGRDLVVSALSVGAQRSAYGQLSTAMRIRVLVRDGLTCQSCEFRDEDPASFHVHHVQARRDGGANDLENLTTLCCDCHRQHHRGATGKTSTQCNYRLKESTIASIKWLAQQEGVTDTEIVERAIAMYDQYRASGGGVVNSPGLPAAVVVSVPRESAERIDTGSTGHLPCRHCGLDGQIHPKTNPWRACPGCQRDGHMNFADCGKCARRDHAQGLAASSSAADTSDIDFDPYCPA